jgi:hypothetical protein
MKTSSHPLQQAGVDRHLAQDGFFRFDLQIEPMNLVCPSEAI